jgi:16S rRNA (cytidine1402-2'-O)-methyltransferase
VLAKNPAKGMIISDGKGIIADSIAMQMIIPGYPRVEMILIIHCAKLSSIMLYIIPTPIGNLKDITLRALETLQSVDAIICEDTRVSGKLLNLFGIKKPLIALNDYNEQKQFPFLVSRLKNGENLALISDAGTPLVSDPGFKLVRECRKEGVEVDSLPGPSAVTTALTLSGLPPDKFMFLGFPPDKPGHREKLYHQMKDYSLISPITLILFVAPFKIVKTISEMKEVLGDVEVNLAHELTKFHQSSDTKKISDWLEHFKKQNPKGEYVMLVRLPN